MSKGSSALEGKVDIPILRDIDQPFIFEARKKSGGYRLEFYDTSCPESWRLLEPDLVIICFDISQRLSLINMQRVVSDLSHPESYLKANCPCSGSKKFARPFTRNLDCPSLF